MLSLAAALAGCDGTNYYTKIGDFVVSGVTHIYVCPKNKTVLFASVRGRAALVAETGGHRLELSWCREDLGG